MKLAYLSTHDFSSHLVYLDYDFLLNNSLDLLFLEQFDVALTYRPHRLPINSGVIFIHAHSQKRVQLFFQKAFDLLEDMPPKEKQWSGNQMAIYSVIKTAYDSRSTDMINVDGISIKLLPCEIYNYCPVVLNSIQQEIKNKILLHFKDKRKELMPSYLDFIFKR